MSVLIDFQTIKAAVSMDAVLSHYGIRITHGFAPCPFHRDKHPSMKVYKDGYYCFSCGAGGDVVTFVARMENVRNAEAAAIVAGIGGVSMENSFEARERARRIAHERRKAASAVSDLNARYSMCCEECRKLAADMQESEPYSDVWCLAAKKLPQLEDELDGMFARLAELSG